MINRRQRQSAVLLLLLVTVTLIVSGCWSRKELNEMSLVSAMGIDYVDGEFDVTFQIINPTEVAGTPSTGPSSGETAVAVYKMRSSTITEAIRKTSIKVPRQIYTSHLQLIVIGESLAKEGILKLIDGLIREQKFRSDYYVFTSKDHSAETILKLLPPLERIPASFINGMMDTTEKVWGSVQAVTIFSLVEDLAYPGKELVLPVITVKGDLENADKLTNLHETKSPGFFSFEGLAVYRQDKLVGWLDEQESRGFYFMKSDTALKSTIIRTNCGKQGDASVNVFNVRPSIKLDVSSGTPVVSFSVKTEGYVMEVTCDKLNLESLETLRDLEAKTAAEIKQKIEGAIERTREWDTDIFGIGQQLRRKKPKFWKTYEEKAENLLNDVEIHVNVNVVLRNTGTVANSPLEGWMD